MSVYINQQPGLIVPSDNPLIFKFAQDDYQKYKISFIVKVFLQNFGEIGAFEVYPEAIENFFHWGKIDLSNIVKSYLQPGEIIPTTNANGFIFDAGVNCLTCYIEVYEKYATTASGTPILGQYATSNTIYLFKACLPWKEYLNFNFYEFIATGPTQKFLTDRPKVKLLNTEIYRSNFIYGDTFTFSYLDLNWILGNNLDKILHITLNTSQGYFFQIDIPYPTGEQGPVNNVYFNIQKLLDLELIDPLIAQTITSVGLAIWNESTQQLISPVVFLDVIKPCNFKPKSLKFLNKYGAYDYFLFEHNERKSASIKSYEYQKPLGSWGFMNSEYTIDPARNGRRTYLKQITEKSQLISGYLNQDEQNWLIQLYESPLVYLDYNNNVEQVTITNTSYTIKQDQYDELYNEIVEIEYTTKNSIEI